MEYRHDRLPEKVFQNRPCVRACPAGPCPTTTGGERHAWGSVRAGGWGGHPGTSVVPQAANLGLTDPQLPRPAVVATPESHLS